MIAVALLCSAVSLGGGFWLGGYCTRASMDHLVWEARLESSLSDEARDEEHARHACTLDSLDETRIELARVRQQNAALRERCGAPPELMSSDIQERT